MEKPHPPRIYTGGLTSPELGPLGLTGSFPAKFPEPIAQRQRQLDEFRRSRPHRTKLPETLWQAAVELAREHVCILSLTLCGWTICS